MSNVAIPTEPKGDYKALYKQGKTVAEIAALIGVSKGAVYKCLDKKGVKLRSKKTIAAAVSDLSDDPLRYAEFYKRGWTLEKIAERTGIQPQTVKAWLLKHGVMKPGEYLANKRALRLYSANNPCLIKRQRNDLRFIGQLFVYPGADRP